MGSWAIMALNFALLAGCAFLVANLLTQVAADAIEPGDSNAFPTAGLEQGQATQPAATPAAILERNLFGAQLAGEAQILEATSEPVARTKLPLRLLGTAAATEETRSRAAIEDEKTRKHIVVAVGDFLEGHRGVRVEAIERTRVILDNAGRPEELLLFEDQPALPRPVPPVRQARRTPAPGEGNVRDRLAKIAGEGGDGISKLLSQARITPFYKDGQILGMKVDAIQSGSVFETAGLQNGDVITEVNGIVIDRQEATPAVLEELMNADTIEIAAQRGDDSIQLSADAGDLMELP